MIKDQISYMYCVDALKMKAHVFGEQSVDYAISLNTMSIILYYRKQYDEAAKMAKATIEIYQALLPEVHHLTSTAYFNLALIEEAENRDEEALEHYQQALRIDSRLGCVDNLIMTAEYIADIYQRNEMPDDEKIYREWINELLEQYS